MRTEERGFRPDVEGLRAVAVGLVVLCHAGVPWLAGGYVGVDVFFVLSGFLITGLLVRERVTTGSTSMVGFYARRARRILPAASLVLVVTVAASYHWLGFLRGNAIAEDGKWTAAFAANLHFAAEGTRYLNITAPPSPLQHYWSLAVEEQFYLVWPLLFMAVASFAPKLSLAVKLAAVLALIVLASFAWSVVQTNSNVTWAFFSPLTRAWELAVGALLAVALPHLRRIPPGLGPWLSWSGLAAILASALVFDGNTAFPGYAAALPVAGAAMVVSAGAAAPRAGSGRLLGLPPFQVLGKWSYSLYLWHWPLLIVAEAYAGHRLSLEQNLGLVAIGVGLSAVTYYAIENPIRYARPLTRNPWSSLSVGATLALAAFALCAWQLRDHQLPPSPVRSAQSSADELLPNSTPLRSVSLEDVLSSVAAAPSIKALPPDLRPDLRRAEKDFAWLPPWGHGCLVDPDELVSPPCTFGDPEGTRTVVLLGDSHAAQWLKALDAVGETKRWKVVVLAKTGCPAVSMSISRSYGPGPPKLVGPYPECGPWLTYAISRINDMKPDLVILASCNGCEYMVDSNGDSLARPTWGAALQETLQRIAGPNTKKVVLGDIPRWSGLLDCLVMNQRDIQDCSRPVRAATEVTYNDAEKAAATTAGAPYVDVTPWFCSAVCTPVVGNMVVYSNDYHVTATYANYLSGALQSALEPIMNRE